LHFGQILSFDGTKALHFDALTIDGDNPYCGVNTIYGRSHSPPAGIHQFGSKAIRKNGNIKFFA
jgi:hypothetical protein